MTDESVHPFEVFYDHETEKYYIFAPAGCVLVNGAEVEIVDASYGNVELDLDIDDLPDSVYAHVTKDSNATGGYKVEFDGNATKSGAKWNFRVMRFGAAENDGNQYDVATSVVNLGGGDARVPGNFEPVFADDNGTMKLNGVGEGYWPFGRKFYTAVTVDSSAKIASGRIYLEITHPTSSVPTPSATVIGVTTGTAETALPAATDSKSYIPLYLIINGAMRIDYRSAMSLTMREL